MERLETEVHSREPSSGAMSDTTEVTVVGGERLVLKGGPKDVEAAILGAARGSLMQLAWIPDAGTGQLVGINPDHVVLLRGRDG